MGPLWHDFLYTPLLNLLLFLYSGPAMGNLGVAIIELTILLRTALLPLSLVDERNRYRYEKLDRWIEAIEQEYRGDHVVRGEKIRELLRTHKIIEWSKALGLAVQVIVLVALYQVFLAGLRFTNAETVYTFVTAPGHAISTLFLGYDLAARSIGWAIAAGAVLFLDIYVVQKQREHLLTRFDTLYLLLIPIAATAALIALPTVKSLFVLTSMAYSLLLFGLRKMFFRATAGDAGEER